MAFWTCFKIFRSPRSLPQDHTLYDVQISILLCIRCFPDERDEVEALAERLICRCLTVEVNVTTPRNESQEAALKRVHELLQQLEALCEHSVGKAVVRTKAYLNACLAEPVGCIDQKFQGAILSCTIDDQKSVKCRLKSLLEDLSKTNQDVL